MVEIYWYAEAQTQQKLWNPETLTTQQILYFVQNNTLSLAGMKRCVELVLQEYNYNHEDLQKFDAVVKYYIDQISEQVFPAFEERSMMSIKNKARETTRRIKHARWLYDTACFRFDHIIDIPKFLR